jgi:hypothetical protein
MRTYLLLYVINKTSHLLLESTCAVIVINEAATLFRCDECDTTLPHECRRSGLNDGTIRKCRLGDDVDKDDS